MEIPSKGFLKRLMPEDDPSNKVLKTFLLAAAIMIFVSYATTYGLQLTVAPKVCSSCHDSLPVAQAMQKGNHARFDCKTCHTQTGFGYGLFPAANVIPKNMENAIPVRKEVCLTCHAIENRQVTPHIPIKVPHMKHLEKGIECVNCHKNVIHGKISGDQTRGGGVVTVVFKNNGISMPVCIACHLKRGVPTNCSWCHLQDLKPPSHNDRTDWVVRGNHGLNAQKDVGVCQMCHTYTKDRAVLMGPTSVTLDDAKKRAAEFARSNAFCSACHLTRPPSHVDIWPIIHKQQAIPNRAACLTCHNEEKPKPDERIVQRIWCYKCHKKRDSSNAADPKSGYDSQITNHPENWRIIHPSVVKSIGIVQGKCFNCHASNHCSKCHRSNNIRQIK
jgi:nitrate/TMAO reductase-like tetraheme cytochrome c subunit